MQIWLVLLLGNGFRVMLLSAFNKSSRCMSIKSVDKKNVKPHFIIGRFGLD